MNEIKGKKGKTADIITAKRKSDGMLLRSGKIKRQRIDTQDMIVSNSIKINILEILNHLFIIIIMNEMYDTKDFMYKGGRGLIQIYAESYSIYRIVRNIPKLRYTGLIFELGCCVIVFWYFEVSNFTFGHILEIYSTMEALYLMDSIEKYYKIINRPNKGIIHFGMVKFVIGSAAMILMIAKYYILFILVKCLHPWTFKTPTLF